MDVLFRNPKNKNKILKREKRIIMKNMLKKTKQKIRKDVSLSRHVILKRASINVPHASLTVETACVVPVFLFAVLQILSLFDIYRLQSQIEGALHQSARKMAVYGYANEDAGVLSLIYVRGQINAAVKTEDCLAGISVAKSKIMENDRIDLLADYELKPVFFNAPSVGFCVENRCLIRAFTGYDNTKGDMFSQEGEELVYITEKGESYHRDYQCSALSVSVSCVPFSEAGSKRNYTGAKYYACTYCGDKAESVVYITNYGNRYHSTILCRELKRAVMSVPISKVAGRRACKKCGGGE